MQLECFQDLGRRCTPGKPGVQGGLLARVLFGLCASLCLSLAQASAPAFPPAFESEAPRVRATLERGFLIEHADWIPDRYRVAYAEYCEAARMGSPEGHLRAGTVALKLEAEQAGDARFHLQAASEMGHPEALNTYMKFLPALQSQRLDGLPSCLQADTRLASHQSLSLDRPVPVINPERYAQSLPVERRKVFDLIHSLAKESFLDLAFIVAIASVESNFNAKALSPKNAMGVMQLIPATASRFGVQDPYDPRQNIQGGIRYLEWLHKRFKGNLELVAAAYNAGEGAVDRHKGIPPYTETQLYVRKVLRFSQPSPTK